MEKKKNKDEASKNKEPKKKKRWKKIFNTARIFS